MKKNLDDKTADWVHVSKILTNFYSFKHKTMR